MVKRIGDLEAAQSEPLGVQARVPHTPSLKPWPRREEGDIVDLPGSLTVSFCVMAGKISDFPGDAPTVRDWAIGAIGAVSGRKHCLCGGANETCYMHKLLHKLQVTPCMHTLAGLVGMNTCLAPWPLREEGDIFDLSGSLVVSFRVIADELPQILRPKPYAILKLCAASPLSFSNPAP